MLPVEFLRTGRAILFLQNIRPDQDGSGRSLSAIS